MKQQQDFSSKQEDFMISNCVYLASQLQPKTVRRFLHSILSNQHKLDGCQSMFTQNITQNHRIRTDFGFLKCHFSLRVPHKAGSSGRACGYRHCCILVSSACHYVNHNVSPRISARLRQIVHSWNQIHVFERSFCS